MRYKILLRAVKLFLYQKKRPAHLSIVERLGGFSYYKGKAFIWIVQGFCGKSAELEVIFNRCWVFRDAKCGICKPKLVIYKPYCAVRRIGCNFAAFLSFAPEINKLTEDLALGLMIDKPPVSYVN